MSGYFDSSTIRWEYTLANAWGTVLGSPSFQIYYYLWVLTHPEGFRMAIKHSGCFKGISYYAQRGVIRTKMWLDVEDLPPVGCNECGIFS